MKSRPQTRIRRRVRPGRLRHWFEDAKYELIRAACLLPEPCSVNCHRTRVNNRCINVTLGFDTIDQARDKLMASGCNAIMPSALLHQVNLSRDAMVLGGLRMNALMFECPSTGRLVDTGIEINYANLRKVQPVTVRLFCPRCECPHEWKLSEGFITEPPSLTPWSPCN